MNTLVTGASGFIGKHLLAHLRSTRPEEKLFSLGHLPFQSPGVTHFTCDLTDAATTAKVLEQIKPDNVYHLAGNSSVSSTSDMEEYFHKNFLTTVHLIDGLETLAKPISFFFSSSVHVYGNRTEEVSEDSQPKPVSFYGFSKYLAEEYLRDYVQQHTYLKCTVARLYNCIGPEQSLGFVTTDLCAKIAALPAGEPLRVGSLNGYRSFIDVRDAVTFFPELLSHQGRFEIFNVSSPYGIEISEMLSRILKIAGKNPKIESSEAAHANQFKGLRVKTDKLSQKVTKAKFRPLDDTLKDVYQSVLQRSLKN